MKNKVYTFICPECFNTIQIGAGEAIQLRYIEHNFGSSHIIPRCDDSYKCKGLHIEAICSNCKTMMFECDSNLAEKIVTLNKVCGISTEFCCGGHDETTFPFISEKQDNDPIIPPYVMFKFTETFYKCLLDVIKRKSKIISNFEFTFRYPKDETSAKFIHFNPSEKSYSYKDIVAEFTAEYNNPLSDAVTIHPIIDSSKLWDNEDLRIADIELDILLAEMIESAITINNINTNPLKELETIHNQMKIPYTETDIAVYEDDEGKFITLSSKIDCKKHPTYRGIHLNTVIDYGIKRITTGYDVTKKFDTMRAVYFPDWELGMVNPAKVPTVKESTKKGKIL